MTNPIFLAGAAELAPLRPGDAFTLTGAEARHAVTVKRLAAGEAVDLSDGGGLRLTCTVTAAVAGELSVRVEVREDEPEPPLRLVLVQALAKGDRDELAIETATELGVDAVVPWQAERSIVRWKGEKAARGAAKWRNVVAAAAKQARRARMPAVDELVTSRQLAARVAGAALAIVLHEDATDRARDVVRDWRAGVPDTTGDILLIVGPEGGMSAAEVDAFTAAGARLGLLGRHVLRSSTAGPAAVVVLSDELGRW
ncbi:16S rRNA (uracil(1498)-N(3))-methyltransferase [Specibacter cremeus]|uniref:16S rRNA (uracil(1498)-N(3))-methyltransferase n=1 Tax=Specibacter cremeus TaxID=1629051 RepID=UPI000F7B4E8B|nr:16S rRNA (uracil(1498)-N(3))-methyltransferase [Specibacter cremeus]